MREFWIYCNLKLLADVVTLLKSVNTSACINQLLLSSEEGVALGADLYSDITLCGACLDLVTASTSDNSSFVCGMDSFLHVCHLNP